MKLKLRYKILIGIFFLFLLLIISPRPKYQENNVWRKQNDKVLVMAHAGGKGIYPGNTIKAFDYSYNLGVDVLEMDLQMTQDKVLVLRHGENQTGNIRKMSNCDTVIWKETYDYLYQNCNFGYNFQSEDGSYPYQNLTHSEWVFEGVYLTKLEDLFIAYGENTLYNIEIKADADAWREETADELYNLIQQYNLFEHVLVATAFHDISSYITTTYPEMQISTSQSEAQSMIISSYTLTSLFYTPNQYTSLQIPTSFNLPVINELNLSTKRLINEAHRHNMAVHYWTINEEDEMRRLIELGCDGIITDYPELLIQILNEE